MYFLLLDIGLGNTYILEKEHFQVLTIQSKFRPIIEPWVENLLHSTTKAPGAVSRAQLEFHLKRDD